MVELVVVDVEGVHWEFIQDIQVAVALLPDEEKMDMVEKMLIAVVEKVVGVLNIEILILVVIMVKEVKEKMIVMVLMVDLIMVVAAAAPSEESQEMVVRDW